MEKIENNKKPYKGFWDEEEQPLRPAISIGLGTSAVVTFESEGREINWEDSVFYVFDVMCKGEKVAVKTSSWSLLRALKKYKPLTGKTLVLTKVLVGGKQRYLVTPNEEKVVKE